MGKRWKTTPASANGSTSSTPPLAAAACCSPAARSRVAAATTPPTTCNPYPVPDLQALEGASLLRKRGVNPAQATEAELREAVTRCQGHALALTLLASILRRNRSLTLAMLFSNTLYAQQWPEDIARRLLNYIYAHQLSATARDLLRAFSIYRAPVPLDAAHALLPTISPTQLTTDLNALLNQHLIEPSGTGTGLYQPHTLVAAHARTHFTEGNEQTNAQAIQEAHLKAATYYQQQASTLCPPQEKRRKVDDVQPLIEAVWHLCQAKQWQAAIDLMVKENLAYSLNLWGGNTILLELCQQLVAFRSMAPRTPSCIIYLSSSSLGVSDDLGRKDEALSYYEQALGIHREAGNRAVGRRALRSTIWDCCTIVWAGKRRR